MSNTNTLAVNRKRELGNMFVVVPIICVLILGGCPAASTSDSNESPLPVESSSRLERSSMQTPEEKIISFRGTTFRYDTSLVESVVPEMVKGTSASSTHEKPEGIGPEHIRFGFADPKFRNDTNSFSAEVNIYSIREYERAFEKNAPYQGIVKEKFRALKEILDTKPPKIDGEHPFIPFVDATQVIHAQLRYLIFRGGSGVRFITQFNHGDNNLVNNAQLVYVFQGISADGKAYILATIPIGASFLPSDRSTVKYKDYTMPDEFYSPETRERNEAEYARYLMDVERDLESTDARAFEPNLILLDRLAESIEIRIPER